MSTASPSFGGSYPWENLPPRPRSRSLSVVHTITYNPWISTINSFRVIRRGGANHTIKMDLNAINNIPPPPVPSGGSPFPGWSNWFLLTIVPLVIPLFTGNWPGPLKALKGKVDSAIDAFQRIAETIEDVAEAVDKVADDVVEKLPEGSKLRKLVEAIDDIAENTIKSADCAEEILQKAEDIGDDVEKVLEESIKKQKAKAAATNTPVFEDKSAEKKVEAMVKQIVTEKVVAAANATEVSEVK